MNTKDLITFALAALAFTVAFQFFIGRRTDQTMGDRMVSGQKMSAPKAVTQVPELHKPLNSEIDFVDTPVDRPEVLTSVDTSLMNLTFSNNGAVIRSIVFKRPQAEGEQELQTFALEPSLVQREQGAFLLALNERTPYYYELVGNQEETDGQLLTYQATRDTLTITKQFKVYRDKHQIDLACTIEGALGEQPRLFVPGPLLATTTSPDVIQAIMNNPKNIVQKEPRNDQLVENFWPRPTIFGVEDRYFIHAMVRDVNNLTLRGFYKLEGEQRLTSILEMYPAKEQATTWQLSFYVGPKEISALNAVDARLESTLEYGLFAPISKFLLTAIKFLHRYLPNYGWVIILITLIIKLLLLPFGFRQNKAMKSRKELQRKLAYIEQKYKHDREALMREKAELIRKHGMPDMLGCLPVLVQLPLFYALNRVLTNSIELFRAPFGWIADLSAPDPFYILPLLVAVGMMISFASMGDIRQRLPFLLISLVIGAVMANLAAGLALFIATSTWLTVAENYLKKASPV